MESLRPFLKKQILARLDPTNPRISIPEVEAIDAATDFKKQPMRLGEWLVSQNLLTEEQVEQSLVKAKRAGTKIGEVLLAEGLVSDETMYRGLAEQWEEEFWQKDAVEEIEALKWLPKEVAWRIQAAPVRFDGTLWIATADRLEEDILARLSDYLGVPVRFVVAPPQRVKELLTKLYGQEGLHRATYRLAELEPESSASKVWSTGQKIWFSAFATLLIIGFYLKPQLTGTILVMLSLTYYALNSLYKFKLGFNSLSGFGNIPISKDETDAISEDALPVYTILVPLYKEAGIVELLTQNIKRLDYPPSKLEVLLLCEEDDDETIGAIENSKIPSNYHLIRVPAGHPRTKPKACNYGLLLARGKYTVIYDAEDRPDPDQLKKAVIAFEKSDENIACVQGKLNYFNRDQNILTRWFSAEYAMWFDLVLPGLHYNSHPIPLGGTSNHFKVEVLRELNAWDPFNVTEDADLGIRLWKLGYRTAMIDSITLEEANSKFGNWIRQRSRWIKGYMQTWLVHMRHPIKLVKEIGFTNFMSMQMTVGGIGVTLMNPAFWVLFAYSVAFNPDWIRDLFPGPLYYVAMTQLYVANFLHLYQYILGLGRRGYWNILPALLISPLYWGMMSIAGWKGFIQLFTKPFYWEKTTHGLTDYEEYAHEEEELVYAT